MFFDLTKVSFAFDKKKYVFVGYSVQIFKILLSYILKQMSHKRNSKNCKLVFLLVCFQNYIEPFQSRKIIKRIMLSETCAKWQISTWKMHKKFKILKGPNLIKNWYKSTSGPKQISENPFLILLL